MTIEIQVTDDSLFVFSPINAYFVSQLQKILRGLCVILSGEKGKGYRGSPGCFYDTKVKLAKNKQRKAVYLLLAENAIGLWTYGVLFMKVKYFSDAKSEVIIFDHSEVIVRLGHHAVPSEDFSIAFHKYLLTRNNEGIHTLPTAENGHVDIVSELRKYGRSETFRFCFI